MSLIAAVVGGFVVLIIVAIGMANVTNGRVSRGKVQLFANRQRLAITADNGNQVIHYLATTSRWRSAGFVAGILASQLTRGPNEFIHFDFTLMFGGWFVGALFAEVRVAHLRHGLVRVASLQPRRPEHYVDRFTWALVPASAALTVLFTAPAVVLGARDLASPDWPAQAALTITALAVAATVRAIQLAVLRRPQPHAAPDVIAADDAIRSRSLHVLCGGGAALVLLLALAQLNAVHPVSAATQAALTGIIIVGSVVVGVLGWVAAITPWRANP